MVKGRLPRESNPEDGRMAGFYPAHESWQEEEFKVTGERNPLPVKDVDVKAELELIKEQQAEILERLDGTFNTQLTGSKVGYSDEEKPTGKKGDQFIELDTKDVYFYDGEKWVIF